MVDGASTVALPGRRLPAGAGWDWIVAGWKLFTRAPLMWIVSTVILFVLAIVINIVPFIGSIVFQLLQTVLIGGFMIACRSLDQGGEFELEHLFAGFRQNFGGLVLVGVIFMAGGMLILLVFAGFVGFSILGAMFAGNSDNIVPMLMASGASIAVGVLVVLALMVPLLAASWFAPALVALHGMPAWEAMKASFFACFRNLVPFLVYGIVLTLLAFLALIPFGLGFLVWIPLAIASTYVAYRQIFVAEEPAAVVPA